jgi:ParB/RepB/Spo0J family partition protein
VSETHAIPLDAIDEPSVELRSGPHTDALYELADSIAKLGLLQPIGVAPIPGTDRYRRVWGGRRLAACRLLRRATIPAVILAPETDELDAGMVENIHRTDLTPVEEARAIRHALSRGIPPRELALRWRKTSYWIEQRNELADWPDDVLAHVHTGAVSIAAGYWLAKIDNPGYRRHLADQAAATGATALLTRTWWTDYESQRPRIIANQTTVDDLLARGPITKILVECDACRASTDLTTTRTYRVCPTCRDHIETTAQAPATEHEPRQ